MRKFCLGFDLFCLQTVCASCEIPFVDNLNNTIYEVNFNWNAD